MPIASRLINTGTFLVNGSFDENTSIAPSNFRTESTTEYAAEFDEMSLPAGSIIFDAASTEYLTIPDSLNQRIGTNSFTIEAWLYVTITDTNPIYSKGTDGTNGIFFGVSVTTNILVVQSASTNLLTSSTAILINQWQHVAVSRDGSDLRLFINGILQSTVANATNFSQTADGRIGRGRGTSANYYNGRISNFRLVIGTAVYTASFTPPRAILPAITNTQLLLNAITSATLIKDASLNNVTITNNGTTIWSPGGPYNQITQGAIALNGTNQYLTAPANSVYAMGTGDWTVEAWIYLTTPATNGGATTDKTVFGGFNFTPAFLCFINNSTIYRASIWNGTTQQNSSITILPNVWTHVAWVRQSGTLNIYTNGVSGVTVAGYTTNWTTSTTAYIGKADTANNRYFPGYISNLRVVKGTAVYTAAFTPSTSPLTAISGTSLLLNVANATNFIKDSSTNNFTVTNINTAIFIASSPLQFQPNLPVQRQLNDGTRQVYTQLDEFTGAPVVDTSLQLWLDAAQTASYPGSGVTWTDLSTTPKNYTLTASPTFNSITGGGVITFAGASSQYATSASTLFNSTTFPAYTLSLWVYPTGAGNFVQVDGQTTPNSGYHYSAIEISAAGVIKLGQWTGTLTTIATSTQSLNAWYNLAITYSSTLATAYINGVSVGTSATTWTAPGANTFMALMATDDSNMGTSGYASGSIGAFMVYNRALTADEITTNFNALRNRYGI